jgi:hypothetical protein
MTTYIIQRRKSTKHEWKATTHIIEAESANGALRKFGLAGAYKSADIQIVAGHQTGRQYRAVTVTEAAATVTAADAPVAAVEVKANVEAPYGYKKDGTPRKRPVPTWLLGETDDSLTVKSAHSDKPTYTREQRLANLAKARAKRAENIAARKGERKPRKPTAQESAAAELIARLDALKAECIAAGVSL